MGERVKKGALGPDVRLKSPRNWWYGRLIYRSLRPLHERALHGTGSAVFAAVSRALPRYTGPPVKLH